MIRAVPQDVRLNCAGKLQRTPFQKLDASDKTVPECLGPTNGIYDFLSTPLLTRLSGWDGWENTERDL